MGGCKASRQAFAPTPIYPAHAGYPVRRGFSIQSRLSLECRIAHSTAQMRTKPMTTIACVAKWHSKFHAAARGIEATPLKK